MILTKRPSVLLRYLMVVVSISIGSSLTISTLSSADFQSWEAESGIVTSPMKIVSDSSARGDAYVVQTQSFGEGSVSYKVNIDTYAEYQIKARTKVGGSSENSVYVQWDNDSRSTR